MTDDEIAAIADGIFLHLKKECDPTDALLAIIMLLVMYYDQAKRRDVDYTIDEFTTGVATDAADLYKRTVAKETMQ